MGEQTAEIDLVGGRIISYRLAGRELIQAEADAPTSAFQSALLAPWPNRVSHGTWRWADDDLQLPINEEALGTSLHGLVAFSRFFVVEKSDVSVRVRHDLAPSEGYPFPLQVEATYRLADEGLQCTVEALATGDRPTPVALGVHPYLRPGGAVDDVVLQLPAEELLCGDDRWDHISRRRVDGDVLDLRQGRHLGPQDLDHCWSGLRREPDGRVQVPVTLADGFQVVLWCGAAARYIFIYTAHTLPEPWRRRSVAIEPCTAPPNAFRSRRDLDVLVPGQRLVLEWGLQLPALSGSSSRATHTTPAEACRGRDATPNES